MTKVIRRLLNLARLDRKNTGQSTTEFAFMFPVFLGVLIGLVSFSLLFYSYVTAHLAVREGAGALIRNPGLDIYTVRKTVCDTSFSFDKSKNFVKVEPPDGFGTAAAQCSNLNPSEGPYLYWSTGIPVAVTSFYTVPLPTVSLPTWANGGNAILLGPIQISAKSVMTIE